MVAYKCLRCSKNFDQRYKLCRHLKKKSPCIAKTSFEVSCNELLELLVSGQYSTTIDHISSTGDISIKNVNDFDANVNDFDANVNDFDANVNDFDANVNDFDANVNDFDANVNDLDSNVNDLDSNVNDFDANVNDFDANVNDFEQKSSKNQSNFNKNSDISIKIRKKFENLHKNSENFVEFEQKSENLQKNSENLHKNSGNLHKNSENLHKNSGNFVEFIENSENLHKNSGNLNICKNCKRSFSTRQGRSNHMRLTKCAEYKPQVHTIQILGPSVDHPSPFICYRCNRSFTTKVGRSKHIKLNKCNILASELRTLKRSDPVVHSKMYSCHNCNRVFTSRQGRSNHMRLTKCKELTDSKHLTINFQQVTHVNNVNNVSNVQHTQNVAENLTQNLTQNITNGLTENIRINRFGREDVSYITSDVLEKVAMNPSIGIPKLVELIHFNPHHPENHNVKLVNKKEPFIDYFNGEIWKTAEKSRLIGTLLSTKKELVEVDKIKQNDFIEWDKYCNAIEFFVDNFVFEDPCRKPSKKTLKKIYKHLEKDIYAMILGHRKYIKELYSKELL